MDEIVPDLNLDFGATANQELGASYDVFGNQRINAVIEIIEITEIIDI